MAQEANTFDTTDAVGNREDLTDIISNISPHETPFYSKIAKGAKGKGAKSTKHEWQTDKLAAPDTDNAQIEGDKYSYDDITPTKRVNNLTQIVRKSITISETQEAVDSAGRKSEMAYQTAKRGKELKRDIEAILLNNQASSETNTADGPKRKLGGLAAWLETNTDRGTGGADGGFNDTTKVVDAATDGTTRAFARSQLDGVIESCFTEGADPTILMLGPKNKRAFSGFTGISELRTNMPGAKKAKEQAAIIAAADFYVSDFGTLTVIPNRFQRERDAFVLDPEYIGVRWLRRLKRENPDKNADARKRIIIGELTLRVDNEAAHGVVADLSGA